MEKLTNYDVIKTMSKEELAAIFYILIKPLIEAFEFESEDQIKKAMQKHIKAFLDAEVKKK